PPPPTATSLPSTPLFRSIVLDEPTNDLDVDTLELLEDLLAEYEGTLLLVSHDRTFLDNVVTSTLVTTLSRKVRSWLTSSKVPSYSASRSSRSSRVSTSKSLVGSSSTIDRKSGVEGKEVAVGGG